LFEFNLKTFSGVQIRVKPGEMSHVAFEPERHEETGALPVAKVVLRDKVQYLSKIEPSGSATRELVN
jgi:hypothetical protein